MQRSLGKVIDYLPKMMYNLIFVMHLIPLLLASKAAFFLLDNQRVVNDGWSNGRLRSAKIVPYD